MERVAGRAGCSAITAEGTNGVAAVGREQSGCTGGGGGGAEAGRQPESGEDA